jgi:hypothetical protein
MLLVICLRFVYLEEFLNNTVLLKNGEFGAILSTKKAVASISGLQFDFSWVRPQAEHFTIASCYCLSEPFGTFCIEHTCERIALLPVTFIWQLAIFIGDGDNVCESVISCRNKSSSFNFL